MSNKYKVEEVLSVKNFTQTVNNFIKLYKLLGAFHEKNARAEYQEFLSVSREAMYYMNSLNELFYTFYATDDRFNAVYKQLIDFSFMEKRAAKPVHAKAIEKHIQWEETVDQYIQTLTHEDEVVTLTWVFE